MHPDLLVNYPFLLLVKYRVVCLSNKVSYIYRPGGTCMCQSAKNQVKVPWNKGLQKCDLMSVESHINICSDKKNREVKNLTRINIAVYQVCSCATSSLKYLPIFNLSPHPTQNRKRDRNSDITGLNTVTDWPQKTWSRPICPLWYHSLVQEENNSSFVGIEPIQDVEFE